MTRKTLWAFFCVGGLIYTVIKIRLGFDAKVSISDWLDAAYWSGAALSAHWMFNRQSVPDR